MDLFCYTKGGSFSNISYSFVQFFCYLRTFREWILFYNLLLDEVSYSVPNLRYSAKYFDTSMIEVIYFIYSIRSLTASFCHSPQSAETMDGHTLHAPQLSRNWDIKCVSRQFLSWRQSCKEAALRLASSVSNTIQVVPGNKIGDFRGFAFSGPDFGDISIKIAVVFAVQGSNFVQ